MALWQVLRRKLGIDGPRLPPHWVRAVDTAGYDDALQHIMEQHDDEAQEISTGGDAGIEGDAEIELECVALSNGQEPVIIRCGDLTLGELRQDYAREYSALIARVGGELTVRGLLYREDSGDPAVQLLVDMPDPEDLT